MKKNYIKPLMNGVQLHGEQMIAASGVKSVNNGVDIGYGGVDEDGSLDAEVKANPHGDSSWPTVPAWAASSTDSFGPD